MTEVESENVATPCAPESHQWSEWVGAREPSSGVTFFYVRTCSQCSFQEIEDISATRASGGPVKLAPPNTLRLDKHNRIIIE